MIESRFCHHDPFEYEYEYRFIENEHDRKQNSATGMSFKTRKRGFSIHVPG